MALVHGFWQSVTPAHLFAAVGDDENRRHVTRVMNLLSVDPVWTRPILEILASGEIEIRCFTSWLARELKPRAYLEVGVRRGFSLAMVASRAPEAEIYGLDLWIPGYASSENPGADFVQAEVQRVGYPKRVHFVSGDSHQTLPALFAGTRASLWEKLKMRRKFPRRPQEFDLITVDGDHSLLGAHLDLSDVMPLCRIGGVVVLDDIAPDHSQTDPAEVKAERGADPHGWHDLLGVWHAIAGKFKNFRYFEYIDTPPGVALAVRLS